MAKIYFILIMISSMLFSNEGNINFIFLDANTEKNPLIEQRYKASAIIEESSSIQELMQDNEYEFKIVNYADKLVLRVGPFTNNNLLALTYMNLKTYFPKAFIMHETVPIIKEIEKQIFIDREINIEKTDSSLWIAIFGLATIGILFMFLSSENMKRLKQEHEDIKEKHKKLEEKQHEVLSNMGENIHTIAKDTMDRTHILADKVKDVDIYNDMQDVIYNENELLDMTSDLIKFLRLKSKKVSIENEVFNFNLVLNEVIGVLSNSYKNSNLELIFNIESNIPKFMYSDSLHLGQILINLLDHIIQSSQNREVILNISIKGKKANNLHIEFNIDSDIRINNQDKFFESYYDDKQRKYVGLGLFVAKELTLLMQGNVEIHKNEDNRNILSVTIPIESKDADKRKYRLPDTSLVGKKILIVDESYCASLALEKLFKYFKADTKVFTFANFTTNMPNLALFDIVAFGSNLFTAQMIKRLKGIRKNSDLKVIRLENIFNEQGELSYKEIDKSIKKPFSQEYIFDTLVGLYYKEQLREIERNSNKLPIYREGFKYFKDITLDDFYRFAGSSILLVEDNLINQKVVLSILAKSGMNIAIANNGDEAVEFMKKNKTPVDFIFMDINMPIMDGFHASQIIREDTRFDTTAIVSLTALVSEHEVDKMFESGMNGYLAKPVHIEKLYSALYTFLSKDAQIEQDTKQKLRQKEEKDLIVKPVIKLDGLDVEYGLARTNNVIFYKEVLREFLDAYSESNEVLKTLVNEARFTQLKMLCLDMRGVTGTIGAKDMHRLINEIYQYLIYKKPELLHSYVDRYETELAKVIKAIKSYLNS